MEQYNLYSWTDNFAVFQDTLQYSTQNDGIGSVAYLSDGFVQIQEIDNLNKTISGNIQLDGGTGVITATSFKGSGANLTGIAVTSDINTNNIKVSGISTFGSGASTFPGAVSVTNTTTSTSTSTGALIVSGGVGIAKSLFVGENVSIGGTLTYEDVTNIDSVGVVTARTGIKVLAGGINAVGVVTATTIHVGSATTIDGSGINVTGIVTAPVSYTHLTLPTSDLV